MQSGTRFRIVVEVSLLSLPHYCSFAACSFQQLRPLDSLAKELRGSSELRTEGHASFMQHGVQFLAAYIQPSLGALVGIHCLVPGFSAMLKGLAKQDLVPAR